MLIDYAWLIWTLLLFLIWLIAFLLKTTFRKDMIRMSLYTMFFGAYEPFFVPDYWTPPSLFNLAQKTGFDIESFIFCFSLGGIASCVFQSYDRLKLNASNLTKERPKKMILWWILCLPIPIFLIFRLFPTLSFIYLTIIAMIISGTTAAIFRHDLKYKLLFGGITFLAIYSIFFYSLLFFMPNYVEKVWNLPSLWGISIFKLPIEELILGFSFGLYWTILYEYLLEARICSCSHYDG